MSRRAWLFVWMVLIGGCALTAAAFPTHALGTQQLLTWGVLTALASITQMTKPDGHGYAHHTYYASPIFFFAGIFLLHPFLIIVLIIIPHLVEWSWSRWTHSSVLAKWYIQPFNVCKNVIAAIAAWCIYLNVSAEQSVSLIPVTTLAVVMAAVVYVMLDQAILGMVLVLSRGVSWRKSGTLDFQNLLTEGVLVSIGYGAAVFWKISPWLILPAISPLLLITRALMEEAQTDAKTKLFNARHFNILFADEMSRAQRFNHSLAFIMADLDLLRNINNTYGHLAGDVVLQGIAELRRTAVREYDIAARLGGEEFALVLPETGEEEALQIAERIRQAIEDAEFVVSTSAEPLKVTMSFGVAVFPHDATSASDLTQEADVAVYQAKLQGRNRVVRANDVPHSIKLEQSLENGQATSEYRAAFKRSKPGNSDTAVAPRQPVTDTIAVGPRWGRGQHVAATSFRHAIYADQTIMPERHRRRRDDGETVPPPLLRPRLWLFLAIVISSGVFAAGWAFLFAPINSLVLIGLLSGLALLAEFLQVTIYSELSISVALVFIFAAALGAGLPGVIGTACAVAIGGHLRHRRPLVESYKTAFNAATHILAGLVPAGLPVLLTLATPRLWFVVPIGLAAIAYFVIDTLLITAAISLSTQKHFVSTWHTQFKWLAPHYLVLSALGAMFWFAYSEMHVIGLVSFVAPVLLLRYTQKQYVERTQASMRELQRMNIELASANQEVENANEAIGQVNEELFLTLAKVFDARDPATGSHATRVAEYATVIAHALNLPFAQAENVRRAGFLHDIGKIAIPEEILYKPSQLTPAEYELVKTHAAVGAEFLETSQALRYLAPFVRFHHERWDGRGYPQQLRDLEIPLEARILCVCDSVEAMASDRPYHKGMPLDRIIAEVQRCAGSHFDPQIAAVFVECANNHAFDEVVDSGKDVTNMLIMETKRPGMAEGQLPQEAVAA
ncbi:MAG: hypothetical protein NVS4B8_05120 [Herpetosiphon sp.]